MAEVTYDKWSGVARSTKGTGLINDLANTAEAITSGEWDEVGLSLVSAGLSTVGLLADPFGTLISYGFGWLFEPFEPLKGWLDDLTGNPDEIKGFADTWENISIELATVSKDVDEAVVVDICECEGLAADAYRDCIEGCTVTASAASMAAAALSSGLVRAGGIIEAVRGFVRDVTAYLVAEAIKGLIAAIATLGTGTPGVVAKITLSVARKAAEVSETLGKLMRTIQRFAQYLNKLNASMKTIGNAALRNVSRGVILGASPGLLDSPGYVVRDAVLIAAQETVYAGTAVTSALEEGRERQEEARRRIDK